MAADNRQQDMSQYTSIYSLVIQPGIKRDGTVFQNDQYTDGVWCRFQRGEPKKMGGFATLFNSFRGIFRGMISVPYNGVNYMFIGYNKGVDVFTSGTSLGLGSGPYNVIVKGPLSTSGVTIASAGTLYTNGTYTGVSLKIGRAHV